jgi:quinol monooxygenase YgiN
MIKHIVFWKLKEEANGMGKDENAKAIKQKLEELNGKIEGCIRLEVGFDFLHSAESADVVLYSEFESREALEFYASHPLHKAVMPFIAEARSERRVVDIEV